MIACVGVCERVFELAFSFASEIDFLFAFFTNLLFCLFICVVHFSGSVFN